MSKTEHFRGCHPDHERDDSPKEEGYQPQDTEACWHCGTPTVRGECGCYECWESADDVPPESVYHCRTCGRWWAWMHPRITTIVFNGPAEG